MSQQGHLADEAPEVVLARQVRSFVRDDDAEIAERQIVKNSRRDHQARVENPDHEAHRKVVGHHRHAS
ncbi:hypothetical protein D3C72_2417760 [compost metagenome]